jgi:lipoate synthase
VRLSGWLPTKHKSLGSSKEQHCWAGVTKTSLMLSLGEMDKEIEQTLRDLLSAGVDVITLGGHTSEHQNDTCRCRGMPPLPPEEFSRLGHLARDMGFKYAASGPFTGAELILSCRTLLEGYIRVSR